MSRTTKDHKDQAITIRLSKSDKEKLDALAERDSRDRSGYMRWLIKQAAKKEGIE